MPSPLRGQLIANLRQLRAPEGYLRAGSPRYATLFGRDSLIAAWQTLDVDPAIARDTLRILSRYQGRRVRDASEEEPGKILHEHRFDPASQAELPHWQFPYYGSVDSTLLFLIVGGAYVSASGDESLATGLREAFMAAHRWIAAYGDRDGDGFVEYERRNPRGLFHQGWKDGEEDHLQVEPPVALVEVQGYVVAAHRAFADLADRWGDSALAANARRAADQTMHRLNEDFWMADRGFFGLALDGRKKLRRAVTSNPGHLLLCGAVDGQCLEPTVARLFQPDMWTSFGVRTLAASEPGFDPYSYHCGSIWPHDNWFFYRGLLAAGRTAEAERVRAAVLRAYAALGRIPELYAVVDSTIVDLSTDERAGVRANPVQAWATAGLLDMISRDESGRPIP